MRFRLFSAATILDVRFCPYGVFWFDSPLLLRVVLANFTETFVLIDVDIFMRNAA